MCTKRRRAGRSATGFRLDGLAGRAPGGRGADPPVPRGVSGLTREESGEPVGSALNDNLLRELLLSTTLVPPDLALLGHSG
jgi:hypothetical protein